MPEKTPMLEVRLLFTTIKRKQLTWAIIEVHHTSTGDANTI
ncbi:oxidoreductase [Vibrio mediterranei]|nr:oxidoreductase [Vibrio mediterranei]